MISILVYCILTYYSYKFMVFLFQMNKDHSYESIKPLEKIAPEVCICVVPPDLKLKNIKPIISKMKDAPFIDLLIKNKTYKKHLSVCVNYK